MKRAFITGICGQDGAYLAQLLLEKGYRVFGGTRRSSLDYTYRLRELNVLDRITLINFDLNDPLNVYDTVLENKFDEIYNLAAQSFVGASWDMPIQTSNIDAMGPLYILDAIKRTSAGTKFYQASTSEMFGLIQEPRQSERTPLYPRSPYGVAKQFAHSMTINYRESFGLHASSGILFNHESPLRGLEFVTRKITNQLSRVRLGKQDRLVLGNMDAKRDWGYAKDYVEGMWLMLQQDNPDDYVLATGKTFSVREFAECVALHLGMDLVWEGEGISEIGFDAKTGKIIIEISEQFFRPAEVDLLLGDPSKAKQKLGWEAKLAMTDLAKLMAEFDFNKEKMS